MTPSTFEFHFTTTCARNSQPYVAHVTWNASREGFDRTFFPMTITPTGRFDETATCTFHAASGDIIETRRGRSKKRDFRSFNLVAPSGHLIMLSMSDDITEIMGIMDYLAGNVPANQLSKGRWDFRTVTSDWPGTPLKASATADSTMTYAQHLQQAERTLAQKLSQVRALILDQPTPPTPKASKKSKTGKPVAD